MSERRIWTLEDRVSSLKAQTDRLERAINKLEAWAASHQAATVDQLAADSKLKDQEEVEPP